jgi:predicted nuclease of predicted toxin-antitoxin system
MLRLLTDENFNERIIRGLRSRSTEVDCLMVKEAGLTGWPDSELLRWAARENRTMLSHDVQTMVGFAHKLMEQNEPMSGLIIVPDRLRIGRAIKDLELVVECHSQSEMRDQIKYLPL